VKKRLIALSAAILVVKAASAAPVEEFTCEMIKEQAVRESCIASRSEKGRDTNGVDKKNKGIEKFVAEAKGKLTENFKDPASAQFTR
jgi:hypothetical protein